MQMSTAVRNAVLEGIEIGVGPSPKLLLFSEDQPANCAAADPAGLLATFSLPSDWLSDATGAVKSRAGLWTAIATGSGVPRSWRIKDSSATTCGLQGSASGPGGGGELIVEDPPVVSGRGISVVSFSLSAGNG